MNLPNIIESILFVHGEPMKVSRLAKILNKKEAEVEEALAILRNNLAERGLKLAQNGGEAALITVSEASGFIQGLLKEEFSGKLTRAALETLAIVVYSGPLPRPEIDFIRGVNSSFTLRNLLVSGLVEREISPKDRRTFIYKPSMDFLRFLGLSKLDDLPEYGEFRKNLEDFSRAETNNRENKENVE
ncbi:MAG: SMC-Scp complex subunit ScpB [Patescibacteria group bacterium]